MRREFGVSDGMLNVSVPEIILQRSRVSAAVCQVKPGRMPEHMGVNLDPEVSHRTSARDQFVKPSRAERRSAL
jgi:hypothetical protein